MHDDPTDPDMHPRHQHRTPAEIAADEAGGLAPPPSGSLPSETIPPGESARPDSQPSHCENGDRDEKAVHPRTAQMARGRMEPPTRGFSTRRIK